MQPRLEQRVSKNLEAFMRGRNKDRSIKSKGVAAIEDTIARFVNDSSPEARLAYRASRDQIHDTDPAPTSKGAWFPKKSNRQVR
ncbi:hypothetical protein pphageT12_09 [Pseudomonas phage pphageT12]|uniref:Uncharacterized protein n=1 Tax=Pseudomonas phage phiB1_1 TaxID=2755402 RepID=A0A7D7JI34_9CAUD|nr:hypothetical protein phiB1_1_05 [Pseudomonas phage phiB1_1]UAW53642.1 hypothetical protein pphageB21_09 [Pseudomonas phage pphageB21]UAW53701.1 hypothetical protein pphageT21_09 [Pseudomonas phage pphageT21]UAW53760.1 hypothetical protein pphageT12_09 [Pseudomonas phage pphageT12]UAW53821.1 hypothetical protein pphageBV72_09 [Pseudomonas phage pphageBV72]